MSILQIRVSISTLIPRRQLFFVLLVKQRSTSKKTFKVILDFLTNLRHKMAACFSPNYKDFDQLLQTVKEPEYCSNIVLKGFPQISIPELIYTILGIIDLLGFRIKVLNPTHFCESRFENLKPSFEILIVEIQPVLLEKMGSTTGKTITTHTLAISAYESMNKGNIF